MRAEEGIEAEEGEVMSKLKIAYADPPYIGCAHLYKEHEDYNGEVNHRNLIFDLTANYDGFVLHASSPSLREIASLIPDDARIMSWVKPFAAFKKNVPVAYAWEPVIVRPARKPVVSKRLVLRDWVDCGITMKRGLTGAKPEKVCHWAFEVCGLHPDDTLVDMFPGTGAVMKAWESWRKLFILPRED